ncbi:hypothetical protein AUC45_10200 [Erythrobacter sp. YT30]|nr:hypothetical protein AUC45_10200 [Erythrobacter sp. YT30]
MTVRLAEKFVGEARQSHSKDEHTHQQSRTIARPGFPKHKREDNQQSKAFKPRLIKLAGMAREFISLGKHHRPGNIGDAAPQFTIVEIRKPPEEHAHWHGNSDVITHAKIAQIGAPAHERGCDHHSDQPAMESHPAFPYFKQFPFKEAVARKIEEHRRIVRCTARVESGIPQPPADYYAQCAVEKQIIDMPLRHRRSRLLDHFRDVPIGKNDTDQISERIIPEFKPPDFEQRRA